MKGNEMSYTYPDKDDRLTCQLIEKEFDGEYWAESEARVLVQAREELRAFKEKRNSSGKGIPFSVLDLGCGMGRLFSEESMVADEITAAEPDANRFSAAENEGHRVSQSVNIPITVINGDASSLPQDKKYSAVISSHVLQHITCNMAADMMKKIADLLEPEGILVMTTTYTEGEEDRFFCESWEGESRKSEKIDRERFDGLFGADSVLPVRMFAEDSIVSMAGAEGMELLRMSRYHYQNHHSIAEDEKANLAGEYEGARDAMYIFRRKSSMLIDGNICYHFSFSIFDEETGLRTDDEKELRDSIKKAYPDAVFMDEPKADDEPLFRDLKVGENFLHGGGLPFNCFRVLINNYDFKFRLETVSSAGKRSKDFDIRDSAVFMTVFPESDTVQVCICLTVKNGNADDFVYCRQVQGNGAVLQNADGRQLSVREIFNEVSSCLGRKITDVTETYLVEIKRLGKYESVDEVLRKEKKLIYGLMTGDEGWRHVPEELADERLCNLWGSRDFIRLISFGANTVFFNLFDSSDAVNYRADRMDYDHNYYGDMNPYFEMNSNVAGVNHGVLFSAELVMVIKTICNRILRRQADYYTGGQSSKLRAEIRKIKTYRGELITTLNKVENLEIAEIGEMERVLLTSQQIEPIIEKIKYLLELLESELDLLYQTSTNRLINLLTIAGLVLAAIQVLQGIL
ncbi:MAG: class I SAM-dependent methyltransferase [Firmicutes bacterium]|nr:class I SAM-dependent methyltransferase [Bacillota bacterium]